VDASLASTSGSTALRRYPLRAAYGSAYAVSYVGAYGRAYGPAYDAAYGRRSGTGPFESEIRTSFRIGADGDRPHSENRPTKLPKAVVGRCYRPFPVLQICGKQTFREGLNILVSGRRWSRTCIRRNEWPQLLERTILWAGS